ncbi:hypothetical protein MSPP1_004218 [Malassezia sp. CBS 17886]|nr:hypothetical protein MSPP1_004218 [Malassezia sp. CBS 17886]
MAAKYSNGGAVAPSAAKQPSPSQDALGCPALHLYPLNDTFVPKQIHLASTSARNRVKIGRYSNAKSVPNPMNGFFDSKVLSRAHAEVWYENDKVYIKDVKSSNGTFVNGTRLSQESQESDPYELHSEDVVDFGIDILTEDNKETLHHRVACRVFLVTTPEDAQRLRTDFTSMYRGGVHGGSLGSAGICPGAEGGLRRGKGGMNLDHVIFRLQNELRKSKMVGTELHTLSSTVHSIHESLNGGVPPLPTAPHPHLVPTRSTGHGVDPSPSRDAHAIDAAAFASLESQLASTQAMLAGHVEKMRGLEATLAAYEHIKEEVDAVKQQLESTQRQGATVEWLRGGLPDGVRAAPPEDDAASIASVETAVPGDVEWRIAAGDDAQGNDEGGQERGLRGESDSPKRAAEERAGDARAREAVDWDEAASEAVKPAFLDAGAAHHGATPAALAGMRDDEHGTSAVPPSSATPPVPLLARLTSLEEQLREAKESAQKVRELSPAAQDVEKLGMRLTRMEEQLRVQEHSATPTDPLWTEWRHGFEVRWEKQQRSWEDEQLRLKHVLDAWSNPSTPRLSTHERTPSGSLVAEPSGMSGRISEWTDTASPWYLKWLVEVGRVVDTFSVRTLLFIVFAACAALSSALVVLFGTIEARSSARTYP